MKQKRPTIRVPSWKTKYIDFYILVPYIILCLIGIVMVYSASGEYIKIIQGKAQNYYLLRQTMVVIMGAAIGIFTFFFKLSVWRDPRMRVIIMSVTAVLLVLARFIGHSVNGATAWIQVGPLNIQPSEFAKLAVILYFAPVLANRQELIAKSRFFGTLKKMGGVLALLALILILVFLQPDTGGMAILGLIILVMLLASGFNLWTTAGITAVISSVIYGMIYLMTHQLYDKVKHMYQVKRFLAVMHPFKMVRSEGKQLVNSMYAINHGGLFGVGLGNGTIKRGYLPEPYTDFILSVISEELGFIGAFIVVFLIAWLIMRIFLIGIRSKSVYRSLVMYGVATMMLAQTVFNVGAVIGLLPITGVTLPFISYGGSSMLVLSFSMGLAMNISAIEKRERETGKGEVNNA